MPNNKPDFSKLTLDDLAPAESNEVDFSKLSLDSLSTANQEQPDFEALPSLYDEFEIADDEQLYKMMKAEPGKAYSREQWDRYLTYMSEKDFSPMQVTKAFFGGIGPMLTEIGQGGLEVAKEISKLYATDGSGRDRKALENIAGMTAEGSLRAGYDMGMIGHMIALNESLSDTVATPSGGLQGGYGSGYSFPNYRKRSYKDFPEDKKDKVIGRAMKLAKYMSDREKYATGQDTIMGDLTSFFADDEESVEQFEAVKDTLAATISPKGAEFLSIFNPFAPEALAAGVGRKFAKPVKLGVKDKVLAGGQTVFQKSADATGWVGEQLDNVKLKMGDEASDLAKVRGVSPGMMQSSFQTIADTLAATRRQVANSGSENFFMKMSRDGDYARANPRMHQLMRFLGHGIYNDIPALSPVLRTAAPAARVVVDTTGGAIEGGISGGIMVLPTQDEDMIGTTMTSGSALGGTVQGGRSAFWDNKIKVNAAAETFLNTLGPDLRKIVDDRIERGELGMGDIARMASFENWLKGFTRGVTGDTDVDFIYWDGADMDFVEKVLTENGVDQALKIDEVSENYANQFNNADADRIVSPTRGVQILNTRRAGSKPIALVNLNSMSGTTSIHEGIHALKRLDLYRGAFDDLESILFDKPGRGEDSSTNGLVSDADLQRYYREYLDRFVQAAQTPEQQAQARKLIKDIVKADQLRADNATPGTPQAEVEYWQRVRMKEEVVSDVFESFLANKDPLYITKTGLKDNTTRLARPFSQVAKTMTSWIMANSNGEALSVQNYTGRDGKRLAYDSPELEATINGLINFRNRVTQKDGKLTRAEAAEGETGDAFKRTQIKRGTALAKSLESSLLVKHDDEGRAVYDADGNIVFEDSQKAIREKERERQTFLRDTITGQIIEDTESIPGKEPVRFDKDTEEISGDYLHEDTMKLLRNAPRSVMPKSLLEHLEKVNEAIKTGNVIEMDYNPRLFTKNGRSTARAQYSSALGSTIRLSIPFSMRMTKAGNFTINTLDVTHLVDKYNRVLGDSKRSKYILSAWGNDRNAFNKDLAKYLENTINPPEQFDGGLASGLDADPKIARQKANRLSAFLGFKKKDIDWKNNEARQDAMLKALNPERQDNLIRTRRLDGINSVRSTDLPRMPLSRSGYKRVQRNFEPDMPTHRRQTPKLSEGDAVLFADDPNRNNHYGPHVWKLGQDLPVVPDEVVKFASDYYSVSADEARALVDPDDIIDNAGAWDDRQFVSDLWQAWEQGDIKTNVDGFRTQDGAVVLNRENVKMKYSPDTEIDRRYEPGENVVRKRPSPESGIIAEQQFVRGQNASFTTRPGLIYFDPGYHGSPYDFDKFETREIGSGEGHAAFGYGLYFAQERQISEGYRKQLSDNTAYSNDEMRDFYEVGSIIPTYGGYDKVLDFKESADGWQVTVQRVEPPLWTAPGNEKPRVHQTSPSSLDYEQVTGNQRGYLYKVDLNIDDSSSLHWDKRLSQQPEQVRSAVEKISKDIQSGGSQDTSIERWEDFQKLDPSGTGVYRSIEEYYRFRGDSNPAKLASEILLKNGVRGIKYLDGASRRSPDPDKTYNYVMFDDADITITEKNDVKIKPSDVQRLFDPGDARKRENKVRGIDVGDKSKKQTELSVWDYPDNPDPDSVALPARLGVVNRNIAGVPNTYAEVVNIVENQVNRIRNMIKNKPEFAQAAANFYRDMAEVGFGLGKNLAPIGPDGKPQQYRSAELMLRLLALGSPRTGVAANATKSVRSTMATQGQPGGYKIGMGTGQLGAKKAAKDWGEGKHFDVTSKEAIGADDKVRNFYLNSLADLIEMAAADQSLTPSERTRQARMLRLMAARTLGMTDGKMDAALEGKVIKFLDGLATVDMWDMASKGYAIGGYIPLKNRAKTKPAAYQWSVPKHRVKSTINKRMFKDILKESKILRRDAKGKIKKTEPKSIEELDYQYAKSLMIEGRQDWDAESWADRVSQGFDADTEFSYFKLNDEAGLSPGGSGPVYDAQQMIDGLIADRVNELGLAGDLGKEKFKARNAQEVIWALEKSDNPLLSNRQLVRFGDRLNDVVKMFDKIVETGRIAPDKITEKAQIALQVIEETYRATSEQMIPIEVTTDGTTPTARKIQGVESIAGAEALTQAVADGTADGVQTILDGMGLDASITQVKTGRGAYRMDSGEIGVSPNMVIYLRGDRTLTGTIMKALSKAWDQEAGNLIRKPTLEETLSGADTNHAVQFDTTNLSPDQIKEFFAELSSLTDDNGNAFMTGFTETPEGIFIGDQYYDGDMDIEIQKNEKAIDAISDKYGVGKFEVEPVIVEDFYRSDDVSDSPAGSDAQGVDQELARLVLSYAKRKIADAKTKIKAGDYGDVNQKVDRAEYAKRAVDRIKTVPGSTEALKSEMGSRVDLAVMDGNLSLDQADVLKKEIASSIKKIPLKKKLTKNKTRAKYREILDRKMEEKAPEVSKAQARTRRKEIAVAKEKAKAKKAKKKAKK